MSKLTFRLMLSAALVCALMTLSAAAQDFQRSYNLGAGRTVNVRNISGDVKVTGYDGNAIVVTGIKTGRDRGQVAIVDQSGAGGVDVRVRYPDNCDCDASVRFEVKVPFEVNYRYESFSSVSGDVEVSGVTGELRAKSVSGSVKVKGVNGTVNASSVSGNVYVGDVNGVASAKSTSGNVEVEIRQLQGVGNMDFGSVSGDVRVKLPDNLGADVRLSTLSGDLKTDFPLQVEEAKYGPGKKATGKVGGGSRSLKLSTTSGSVSLLRM